jgi:hypothetical protein
MALFKKGKKGVKGGAKKKKGQHNQMSEQYEGLITPRDQ